MNKNKSSTETVKKALSETTRAISKKSDLNVSFESETSKHDQTNVQLSRISNKKTKNEILNARGESDAQALFIRYHDNKIDQKYAPQGDIALNLFNEMEQI